MQRPDPLYDAVAMAYIAQRGGKPFKWWILLAFFAVICLFGFGAFQWQQVSANIAKQELKAETDEFNRRSYGINPSSPASSPPSQPR